MRKSTRILRKSVPPNPTKMVNANKKDNVELAAPPDLAVLTHQQGVEEVAEQDQTGLFE